ncbi:MAG: N-acetylmuramoyl-L-alanine amidase family protein [Gemmatimonadales bacterium]
MTLLVFLFVLFPEQMLITTPRGQVQVPITLEQGAAAVAAARLVEPLGLVATREGSAVRVVLAERTFEFELGSAFVRSEGMVYPLVGTPFVARDTLFLPLYWLTEHVPHLLAGRYRWDAAAARFEEVAPPTPHPVTGLVLPHTVVIDPGHGGRDPGNPGMYFPGRLAEKDITLDIGRLLEAELKRRGLRVVLTRSTDTLIDLADRPLFCRDDCDLFVSIHVNSMPRGRRQRTVQGVETYFLSDAKTEDQKRVAQMENDALRFDAAPAALDGPLGFILRDLQLNEYLRESARLAELVQGHVAGIHPGENRGVQQGPFLVLAAAQRPAILVETGFATHPRDGAFLASSRGQRRIADAIADGIVAYLVEFERKLAIGGPGR